MALSELLGSPILIALAVIAVVALTLIVSNVIRPDLVALLTALALGISGVITPQQALGGFSSSAVMTIVGLFIISDALEQTGVVRVLADRLTALSGQTERRMVAVFMSAGALLSLVMNNIAAGAVLLPAAVQVARARSVPPSKLLIPLAYGTLVGGMATLFTTANIIVSGNLRTQGQAGLTMLSFLPIGGLTALAAIGYMVLIGRRLLPARETAIRESLSTGDLTTTYQLDERLWEVRVHAGSPLVDQPLAATQLGAQLGLSVVAIWHGPQAKIAPAPSDRIAADDLLLVLGREERVRQLEAQGVSVGRERTTSDRWRALPVQLSEVVIGPRSPAIGETVKALRLRSKFGLTAVALWREGRSYRTDVGTFMLQAGDALLMVGSADQSARIAQEPGFIVLDQPAAPPRAPKRAKRAATITFVVLLLSALGIVPTAEAMLAGAAALVLAGCLTMDDAYRAVDWRVVVLIAGLLPLGTALTATGAATQIGALFTRIFTSSSPIALIVGVYLFALVLTQLVGGQVAALIAAPIAVSAAVQLGVNPQAVGVATAMACSAAFLTPIAHPVNVLMMGPGGYRFGDFFRVGLGMVVVCLVVLVVGMPLLWRL